MIELNNVSLSFGDRDILKDINLSLADQRIGIVGANGGGKSSLVRLLNGLLLPTQGDVWVDGVNTRQSAKQIRRHVGFVFQNPDNQIIMPTVQEDLAFGMKNLGYSKQDIESKTKALLHQYQLWEYRDHSPHLLSGGQKQLLAIAGVLSMMPKYIVFDEPTTLLDLRNKRMILSMMHDLSQHVIVVSHDFEVLSSMDRVLVLDDGRVVMDDTPTLALDYYSGLMA